MSWFHSRLSSAGSGHTEASYELGPIIEQQIEVRRVGSVELECTSLGERALNWIAAGKLQGFEDGLRTDESGKLSIQGIPHGEYRWTANGSSGTFDLAAGELFNRRLILP